MVPVIPRARVLAGAARVPLARGGAEAGGRWLPGDVNWSDMRQGYNVGRGVAAKAGGTFDGFEAVGATTMELVVDVLKNIKVVNWT